MWQSMFSTFPQLMWKHTCLWCMGHLIYCLVYAAFAWNINKFWFVEIQFRLQDGMSGILHDQLMDNLQQLSKSMGFNAITQGWLHPLNALASVCSAYRVDQTHHCNTSAYQQNAVCLDTSHSRHLPFLPPHSLLRKCLCTMASDLGQSSRN